MVGSTKPHHLVFRTPVLRSDGSCFTSSGGVQEARDRFATILLVPGISPRTNLTDPPLTLIRRFERYSKMEEAREKTTFRLRVHEQRG